jgi:Cd2+/Zn2+-exporting ATPase
MEDTKAHGSCACGGCDNDGDDDERGGRGELIEKIPVIIGAVIFVAGLILRLPPTARLIVFGVSYLLSGGEVLLRAGKNILRGKIFDENFLMAVASIGAFATGEYPEGVAVMLFYQIGETLQELAVSRSRRSVTKLMDLRPDSASIVVDGVITAVPPESVFPGDTIIVRPGERVPLDGVVADGVSSLDTSALTGESLPRYAERGDEVLSGSVNMSGLLTITVTKPFGESTVSKILKLTQEASDKKAPTENFITKFARYYTPAVVFAALALALIPPLIAPGQTFSTWVSRALIFLVVSCPCALVVSIPLGFFAGIGGAARRGILVKGGNYLEALCGVDTVVFDKTGTLTKGVFRLHETLPADGVTAQTLLSRAAAAETHSNHPIAASIRAEYDGEIDRLDVTGFGEVAGRGVSAVWRGETLLAGARELLISNGVDVADDAGGTPYGTVVYVSADGRYLGKLVISDEIKPESAGAVTRLRALGVTTVAMLTGDRAESAEVVGDALDIDVVRSELLPHEKVEAFEALQAKSKGATVFVGDGINDAPVLARSDIGVAMGGVGSDAAIEASDIVLMTDDPTLLATAIAASRRTRRIVWQNIVFALGVKAVILALGALGIATMWIAVFGDVGVALLAVLNSLRAMAVDS